MKKAVIVSGGKQYLVSEGETVTLEKIKEVGKNVDFDPIMIIDGEKTVVGTPNVQGAKVKATVLEAEEKADKVLAIRYKAKKRVHKIHGHRQVQTIVKIDAITV